MNTSLISLFGLFRSGTNYTRTVLEWNYYCQLVTDQCGWKHGFYPILVQRSVIEYPDMDMLFVTKNPFSAINSLFDYYQTNGRNIVAAKEWKQFLRGRFVVYDAFQDRSPQYRFANVVEYWNSMHWNLASVQREEIKAIHVRYEDMLENALETAQSVADILSLKPRFSSAEEFRVPSRITKNMADEPRQSVDDYLSDEPFKKDRYIQKDYYQRFDEEDVIFVLDNLDKIVLRHLGYLAEMDLLRARLTKRG